MAANPAGMAPDPLGAPVYSIEAKVLAGGTPLKAESPCFDLLATIGQPVSGASQSANFSVESGFWSDPWSGEILFRNAFEDCQP